jgi:hypothetical protein
MACSKLRLMQLQLWNVTYDSKTVQALTVISEQQQQMEQQLRSSIEQVSAVLSHLPAWHLLVPMQACGQTSRQHHH